MRARASAFVEPEDRSTTSTVTLSREPRSTAARVSTVAAMRAADCREAPAESTFCQHDFEQAATFEFGRQEIRRFVWTRGIPIYRPDSCSRGVTHKASPAGNNLSTQSQSLSGVASYSSSLLPNISESGGRRTSLAGTAQAALGKRAGLLVAQDVPQAIAGQQQQLVVRTPPQDGDLNDRCWKWALFHINYMNKTVHC